MPIPVEGSTFPLPNGEWFVVGRLLGSGGMGSVVEATHMPSTRKVALKYLHEELVNHPTIPRRFAREVELASALRSGHVARIFGVGKTMQGTPFMIMELLEGRDVASILRATGALAPGRAVSLIAQACEALEEAHARKIVHRDLKPENLFVCSARDGSDWLKILDFGISKSLEQAPMDQQLTRQGTTVGTPEYMSPEQLRAATDLDARADIYSLGCVMYEMLTGRRPFTAPHYADLVMMVMKHSPTPIQQIMPHVPQSLCAIVERAMAKDKLQRIGSAKQLRDLLGPFLPHRADYQETIAIQPISLSPAILAAHFGPKSVPKESSQIGWILLAIASVLIMVAVLIWFFNR